MTIQAKVASVLNSREVAINAGRQEGVALNDIARVVEIKEIHDPETNDLLGTVVYTIIRLQITLVSERFSVGRTFEYTPSPRLIRLVTDVPGVTARPYTSIKPGAAVRVERPASQEPIHTDDDFDDPF